MPGPRPVRDHARMQARVVAGISPLSGSPAAAGCNAADYAAALAVRHQARLQLVGVVDQESQLAAGIDVVGRVAGRLRAGHVGLETVSDVRVGDPADELAAASAGAFATVVGATPDRDGSGPRPTSIPARLAAHGHGAIVVVRPAGLPSGPVLVGVDGSDSSWHAVGYAAGEAVALGVPLLGVNVCPEPESDANARAEADHLLRQALDPWQKRYPQLSVATRVVRSASPEYALPDLSKHAALTVVGSRGHGGFVAVLLGSVSQLLVRDGVGPVVIVHRDWA